MDSSILVCSCCGTAGSNDDFSRCARCLAACYCDRKCQKRHWKIHKTICGHLNVNEAGQIHHKDHDRIPQMMKSVYDALEKNTLPVQKLFRIFMSKDESDQAYNKMKKILLKEPSWRRHMIMFQSLTLLGMLPIEMVTLRTSPLQMCLQVGGCDPNAWSRPPKGERPDKNGSTPLHWVAEMADPQNFEANEIQVIMGEQLIKAGANVNARADVGCGKVTPLHRACHSSIVTNLDFIRLLLEHGADPNLGDYRARETPLMHTMECSLSAAKLLLTFSCHTAKDKSSKVVPINPNVQSANGSTFLGGIRECIGRYSTVVAMGMDEVKAPFILQQLYEVQELLLEMGAVDNGWRGHGEPWGAEHNTEDNDGGD